MNNPSKYIQYLQKWCKELSLSGKLIFILPNSQKSTNDRSTRIFHILEGDISSFDTFLKRSKTVKVDVDSKGNKCKEKMMKVLWKGEGKGKHFDGWEVMKIFSKDKQEIEKRLGKRVFLLLMDFL